MADNDPENSKTVTLTSMPVMLTSEGQLAHILDLGSLTGDGTKPIAENDDTFGGNFSILFETVSGSADTLDNSETDKTLLEPMSVALSSSSSVFVTVPEMAATFSTEPGSSLASHRMLSDADLSLKPKVILQTVNGAHVDRTEVDMDLPERTAQSLLPLSDVHSPSLASVQLLNSEVTQHVTIALADCTSVASTVISQVSEPSSSNGVHSLVLTEPSEGLEIDGSEDKAMVSPTQLFPEGAVLVETPQGLMLSVGDELRAVTLTEEPDAQGNHFLSVSNNCIPVALLSQSNLLGDQTSGETYEGVGDVETEVEPVVCSADLMSHQVLTVSSPDDDEPKKKNRGWPKGKKRKTDVPGPRAPMTGYVIFAIGRRQEIKQAHPSLPFTEVTKVLGQEWSNMAMDKKQKFLDEADNDKQRYIDQLKEFQKSDTYQMLMKRKKYKGEENDGISGDLDDDDELHCKVCKLYFSSLHNKREHMLGRQHLNAVKAPLTDHLKSELKRQQKEAEADLRGDSLLTMDLQLGGLGDSGMLPPVVSEIGECEKCSQEKSQPVDISTFIVDFVHKNYERDQEILMLKHLYQRDVQENWNMCKQIEVLKNYEYKLRQDLKQETSQSAVLSGRINMLKMVPALFGVDL